MNLSKMETQQAQELWGHFGAFLTVLMEKIIKENYESMSNKENEWEHAKQSVELLARKRALIELKEILSKNYGV